MGTCEAVCGCSVSAASQRALFMRQVSGAFVLPPPPREVCKGAWLQTHLHSCMVTHAWSCGALFARVARRALLVFLNMCQN